MVIPGKTAQEKMKQIATNLYQQTPVLEKGMMIPLVKVTHYVDMPQQTIQIFQSPAFTVDKRSQLLGGASSQFSQN